MGRDEDGHLRPACLSDYENAVEVGDGPTQSWPLVSELPPALGKRLAKYMAPI